MAIELDGGQHTEMQQAAKDAQRDRYLQNLGIKVLRFGNADVLKDCEAVVQTIAQTVIDLQGDNRASEGEISSEEKSPLATHLR